MKIFTSSEMIFTIKGEFHNTQTQKARAREDKGKKTLPLFRTADAVMNHSWLLISELSL